MGSRGDGRDLPESLIAIDRASGFWLEDLMGIVRFESLPDNNGSSDREEHQPCPSLN